MDNTKEKENPLDKMLHKVIRDRLHKLAGGHVTAHLIASHEKKKDSKKKVNEEAPTNVMGASSSTAGTGPIDTFDPLLRLKKIMRRKKPI